MSEIIFEIKDLVKKFNDFVALNKVNTVIKKGEVVFVVGPSGSGKSTFLRCLNLLEKPTSGQIIFEEKDVTAGEISINKFRRRVGMVFQHFNLFPHMTVMKNLTLAPMKLQGKTKEEAEKRISAQMPQEKLAEMADVVFVNDGDIGKIRSEIVGYLGK